MKKGVISLDAITAFIILIFLVIFIQKTTTSNLSISDNYGGLAQSKAIAIKVSSIMNSFYATNPTSKDKIIGLSNYTKLTSFGTNDYSLKINKQPSKYHINVSVKSTEGNYYNTSFPTVNETAYDSTQKEIKS